MNTRAKSSASRDGEPREPGLAKLPPFLEADEAPFGIPAARLTAGAARKALGRSFYLRERDALLSPSLPRTRTHESVFISNALCVKHLVYSLQLSLQVEVGSKDVVHRRLSLRAKACAFQKRSAVRCAVSVHLALRELVPRGWE